jgi:hypothetical protein
MWWRLIKALHRWDYAVLLPLLARLPLGLGMALALGRGRFNARAARDWRSMALGTRHIHRMSLQGAHELARRGLIPPSQSAAAAARQRFMVEARDEFEARLMWEGRWGELACEFDPPDTPARLHSLVRNQGAVLLTPHYDSFYLGIAFLAQASGCTVHAMASAVPADPRVDAAVTRHFDCKYRGLERALRGGRVFDMEAGIRPFYRLLRGREALVVLADAPVLPDGAKMEVPFLGAVREMAGGAARLAQHTDSHLAAFVCEHLGGRRYRVRWCDGGSYSPQTMARLYAFMGQAIASEPGRWWAMDLLPNLPETRPVEPHEAAP